ncbi:MAG: hypothetical protein QOE36_821 [Gaiellaceae bacterium]|nr:hypothetical protein [Gaiellaceae bacterium]
MRHESTLVGRDNELAALVAALELRRPLALVGEAGIGKTTLMRAAVEASGLPFREAGGLSTLSWMPRLALARALGRTDLPGDLEHAASLVEEAVGQGALIFDDLQWADAESRDAVALLTGRVALLVAVRRDDASAEAALGALESAAIELLELAPLGDEDAARVVRGQRPGIGEALVADIVETARGNPLVLEELALAGGASESLRRSVAARLRALTPEGRSAVSLLALAGRPLERSLVPETDEAIRLGFALARDGTVEVRHGLVGEAALDGLDAEEARALHSRLARLATDQGEAARHHADASEHDAAHAAALTAADAAETPGARAAYLGLAAENARGADADKLRLRAALALGDASGWTTVERLLDQGIPDDVESRALGCWLRSRARWYTGDPESGRELTAAGLALVAGSRSKTEVKLLNESARIAMLLDGDWPRTIELGAKALALAREVGGARAPALLYSGTARAELGHHGWEEELEQASVAAREEGDFAAEAAAAHNLVRAHLATGDPLRGRVVADAAIVRLRELGLTSSARQLAAMALNVDLAVGDYERVLADGERLLRELVEPRVREWVTVPYAQALIDTGSFDEASALLDEHARTATPDVWGLGVSLAVRAELALWNGDLAATVAYATEHADRFAGQYDHLDELLGVSRGWALLELGGDLPEAPKPSGQALGDGYQAELDGLRALGSEDAGAAESFRAAAAIFAGRSVRDELRALFGEGEALRRAGKVDEARALLEDVEQRAESHGMVPLLARVRRSLRLAGVHRSAGRGRAGRLTEREAELLSLVRDGLTNPEIARRLGLSPKTVEHEVASAATKLGARNRLQAALLADDA